MKYVSLAVIFLTATGLGIAFQRGVWGVSEASVAGPPQAPRERPPVDHLLSHDEESADGACVVVPTSSPPSDDLQFARVSAEMGRKLLARARRSPGKVLLQQAAAHFQACLTHETTTPDAGSLFEEVRASLASIDREMARLDRPATAKPVPTAPSSLAVAKSPPTEAPKVVAKSTEPSAPVETTEEGDSQPRSPERMSETLMFGPDGVPIRRVGPHE